MFYILCIAVFILIVSIIPIIILIKALFVGDKHEVVLFSPLSGTLTYKGEPASNAKIIRTLIWKDKLGETEFFHANESGEFTLPEKAVTLRIPRLAQLVIHQNINVVFNNQEFPIWAHVKMGKELNSELGGTATNFTCELTDEVIRLEVRGGSLETSCKWKSVNEPLDHSKFSVKQDITQ